MKTAFRRFWKLLLVGIISFTGLLLFSNFWINKQSEGSLYSTIASIPANNSGLVLGTSKRVRGGGENLYFKYRIDAAADLFTAGKGKFLIVSGDNSIKEYNETRDMKKALLERGIPEDRIIEDFAGFRTLDSVDRKSVV